MEAHPANKREFVVKGGIPIVISALKLHNDKVPVNQQGFVLLFYVLSNDPQTKMSMTGTRQMALANGIVDVVQKAQRNFKAIPDIQGTTQSILDVLISDWS